MAIHTIPISTISSGAAKPSDSIFAPRLDGRLRWHPHPTKWSDLQALERFVPPSMSRAVSRDGPSRTRAWRPPAETRFGALLAPGAAIPTHKNMQRYPQTCSLSRARHLIAARGPPPPRARRHRRASSKGARAGAGCARALPLLVGSRFDERR
jgi:hypothetical protein